MNKKVNLTPEQLKIIKDILKDYKDVYLFGSRVAGTSTKFSDVDICIKDKLSSYEYSCLKEKFENSKLPYLVDLVQYCKVSDDFKKIIDVSAVKLSNIETLG